MDTAGVNQTNYAIHWILGSDFSIGHHYPSFENPGPCVLWMDILKLPGCSDKLLSGFSFCALFYRFKVHILTNSFVSRRFFNWDYQHQLLTSGRSPWECRIFESLLCSFALVILLWVAALSLSPFSCFAVNWHLPSSSILHINKSTSLSTVDERVVLLFQESVFPNIHTRQKAAQVRSCKYHGVLSSWVNVKSKLKSFYFTTLLNNMY